MRSPRGKTQLKGSWVFSMEGGKEERWAGLFMEELVSHKLAAYREPSLWPHLPPPAPLQEEGRLTLDHCQILLWAAREEVMLLPQSTQWWLLTQTFFSQKGLCRLSGLIEVTCCWSGKELRFEARLPVQADFTVVFNTAFDFLVCQSFHSKKTLFYITLLSFPMFCIRENNNILQPLSCPPSTKGVGYCTKIRLFNNLLDVSLLIE